MKALAAISLLAFLLASATSYAADSLVYGQDCAGKALELEGEFSSFSKTPDGYSRVVMSVRAPEGFAYVHGVFPPDASPDVSSLRPGDRISLKGKCGSCCLCLRAFIVDMNCFAFSALPKPQIQAPKEAQKTVPSFLFSGSYGKTKLNFSFDVKGVVVAETPTGYAIAISGEVPQEGKVLFSARFKSLDSVDLGKLKEPNVKCWFEGYSEGHAASPASPSQEERVLRFEALAPKLTFTVPKVSEALTKAETASNSREAEEDFKISFNEQSVMKSIITVKGDKGSGTGFIANWKGRKRLITNIHVILDNNAQFLTVSNERLEASNPELCADRDLAFFTLDPSCDLPALELHDNLPSIGEGCPAVVYGNSLGAEVNTRLKGKVKAIGPSNLEISAQIVPGNSGSPILRASDGKVLGVASYLTSKPSFEEGGVKPPEVRRFGLRLDNVDEASLQPFDAKKYEADLKAHNAVLAANDLAWTILSDIYEIVDGKSYPALNPSNYDAKKFPSMGAVIKDWNELMRRGKSGGSANNVDSVLKRFVSQVSNPLSSVRGKPVNYKWIKAEIDRQLEINDYYCSVFEKMRKNHNAIPGI